MVFWHAPSLFHRDGTKAYGDSIGYQERKVGNPGLWDLRQLFTDSRLLITAHIYQAFIYVIHAGWKEQPTPGR